MTLPCQWNSLATGEIPATSDSFITYKFSNPSSLLPCLGTVCFKTLAMRAFMSTFKMTTYLHIFDFFNYFYFLVYFFTDQGILYTFQKFYFTFHPGPKNCEDGLSFPLYDRDGARRGRVANLYWVWRGCKLGAVVTSILSLRVTCHGIISIC